MTKREKVKRALNFKEVDLCPKDFGGTCVTSITLSAHKILKEYLGIKDYTENIIDYTLGVVEVNKKIRGILDIDFIRIGLNLSKPELIDGIWTDDWGIKRRQAIPYDYFDVVYNPIKEISIEELDKINWPSPKNNLFLGLKEKVEDLKENSPYAIIADTVAPGIFGSGTRMRGFEQFFIDLMTDEKFVFAFYDRLILYHKTVYKNYLDIVGKYIDVVCFYDDLGTQDRLFLPPNIFKKLIKPYYKELFGLIKNNTDAKLFFHTCGSVYPIIEDLIEVGVDILNPVQPQAKDMDPIKLKNEFGDRLIFWGGIDEQGYLCHETADKVKKNVNKISEHMNRNGGYVLASSHNIQTDVPPENVIVMYK